MGDIKKLTHAEHDARAMLMGRVYDWRDGTYCFSNSSGLISGGMIDAMTFEPFVDTEIHRMREWGNINTKLHPAFGRLETPYAYSEQE